MTRTQSNAAFSLDVSGTSTNIVRMPAQRARILISENVSTWCHSVMEQLEMLTQLPAGWDGYQGVHVTFENAYFTLRMLEAICGPETIAPQIVPGEAGDLQIEWHTMKGDIELHVIAPNDVSAWRALTGDDSDGEELELTNDFTAVTEWVREIAEPTTGAETTAA